MAEQYKHLFLAENLKSEKYKSAQKFGKEPNIPTRDRATHVQKLLKKFSEIFAEKEKLEQNNEIAEIKTKNGTYLTFTSAINCDLFTKSLEDLRTGIRLLNVKEEKIDGQNTQTSATVYIPRGKEGKFIDKFNKYENEFHGNTQKPKNQKLVDSIENISTALLESLWTDNIALLPMRELKWCEVWINIDGDRIKGDEQIQQFHQTLNELEIEFKNTIILFPERAVLLICANKKKLVELMLRSDFLAEFRSAQELAGFWTNESSVEQQDWIDNLLERVEYIDNKIMVCLLDSGVNNGHQLLKPVLSVGNTISVNADWGTNDHVTKGGHGTLMAGIASYGKFEEILIKSEKLQLTHSLCSVKIIPPNDQASTPKELWGDITSQGIYLTEIMNPDFHKIYCLSITSALDVIAGRPSSWSGALDNLSFGEGVNQKLIIVSSGNIRNESDWLNYPESNFISSIENPAQSWNAITIGAYTEKISVSDPKFNGYDILAKKGQLSPHSTTSRIWEDRWPIKPDIVFEGGNILKAPDGRLILHDDLDLLSTSKSFNLKPFDTINATSAATAFASWFAAKLAYDYPEAWPETIRGLMVHSASWKNEMFQQLSIDKSKKADYKNLLRVFGYGVPDLENALYSKESALTLIAQNYIQPFVYSIDKKPNRPESNVIHIYELPWPKDLLLSLSDSPIKLKLTLSYFIEPGAGEIGWKDKYRYQSFGLRFDLNNVNENEIDFRKRINFGAREDGEELSNNSGSQRWTLGANNRSSGSIHSDSWEGTAAELATCNLIAIYPVIGWWRERKHLNKVEANARYSLIVSLETPIQDVPLYTTVKNLIDITVKISN